MALEQRCVGFLSLLVLGEVEGGVFLVCFCLCLVRFVGGLLVSDCKACKTLRISPFFC